MDAPTSPLSASIVEQPPIPSRYLQPLFSILCSLLIFVSLVGITALPYSIAGKSIIFQTAFPTVTISQLLFISLINSQAFFSAFWIQILFSAPKISLPLPPNQIPRYFVSFSILNFPIFSSSLVPLILMILVFSSLSSKPFFPCFF